MSFKLKVEPPIPYSQSELRVFYLLGDKPKDTIALTEAFYRGKKKPYNARQAVVTYIVSLDEKMKANDEPCKIGRTKRRGPIPIEWTLLPRNMTKSQRAAMVRDKLKGIKKRIEAV